jgi:hypothetical protein
VTLAGDAEFIEMVCYDMLINFMDKMLMEGQISSFEENQLFRSSEAKWFNRPRMAQYFTQ